MGAQRLYFLDRAATPAERSARFRKGKRADRELSESWARRRMKDLGHDLGDWKLAFTWNSGKTLWASRKEDGVSMLLDPDTGTARKQRSG